MDAEYLDPAVFGDRIGAESFDAAMSRLSHHFAAKDAEIAKLRAEVAALNDALNYRRSENDELLGKVARTEAERDAARAALDGERGRVDALIDACDEYFGFPKNPVRDTELKETVNVIRARRAAEAQPKE